MARTVPAPLFAPAPIAYDPYLDLGRLLNRLDQNILRADGDKWRRLTTDEFQRMQARFDVKAARNLLTRVEQDTLTMKGSSSARRQEVQAELNRWRALVEHLQERLDGLDEEAHASAALGKRQEDDEDDEDEGDGADDVLAHVLRAPTTAAASQSINTADGSSGEANGQSQQQRNDPKAATPASILRTDSDISSGTSKPRRKRGGNRVRIAQTTTTIPPKPTATAAPPQSTMRLRSSTRRAALEAQTSTAATTTSSQAADQQDETLSAMRNQLLSTSHGPPGGEDASTPGLSTEEAVLDHHRREQEAISEDILRLAEALKQQSVNTARMLDDDKEVVDRVGEGMHKTTENLSAASRGMAVLTRMTEGKGWWGRMMLFGMVYGLMLVLLLLFLFLPKLRL